MKHFKFGDGVELEKNFGTLRRRIGLTVSHWCQLF